ncbi:MAG: hypothetical protein AAB545_02740 [Patescibacteria group bacterium]
MIGTILGTGGATMIEILLAKALKDGVVDPLESDFLRATYRVVRVGLLLSVFSGFGFLLLYEFSGQTARLYNPVLWAKLTIILIILANALLLQARKINLFWGSAFSFVSWWTAVLLGILLTNGSYALSYPSIMFYYLIAVFLGAGILEACRDALQKYFEQHERSS